MQLFFPSFFLFSRLMHTEENLKKSEEKYVTLKSNETAGNISKKRKAPNKRPTLVRTLY